MGIEGSRAPLRMLKHQKLSEFSSQAVFRKLRDQPSDGCVLAGLYPLCPAAGSDL